MSYKLTKDDLDAATDPDVPQCAAKTSSGKRCRRRPILGGTVCPTHGGSAPQVIAKAQHRLDLQQAAKAVDLWGGRRDIHPAEALLELVQRKAAEVEYWRWRVAEVAKDDLLWGITKEKSGGDDFGTTHEAKPHAALVQLRLAERDLADYCAMSIKAGCDAAKVALAQRQADQITMLLRVALADARVTVAGDPSLVILDALRGLTVGDAA